MFKSSIIKLYSTSAATLKKGDIIKIKNDLYQIMHRERSQSGRGAASTKVDIRHLYQRQNVTRRLRDNEFELLDVKSHKMTFLYLEEDKVHVYNEHTMDQLVVPIELFTEDPKRLRFLKGENSEPIHLHVILNHEGNPIAFRLPLSQYYKISYIDISQDTSQQKDNTRIRLSCGVELYAPSYLKVGDVIKVNMEDEAFDGRKTD